MRDDLDDYVDGALHDHAFAAAYADAETRSGLLTELIGLRQAGGITQQAVAERMHTTQSAVSEFENGGTDPRLSTLQRYARAVGAHLVVTLEPDGPA